MSSENGSTIGAPAKPPLLMGTNARGEWIVRDRSGRRGGVFTDRASALRYARLETGERTPPVINVAGDLELDGPPAR